MVKTDLALTVTQFSQKLWDCCMGGEKCGAMSAKKLLRTLEDVLHSQVLQMFSAISIKKTSFDMPFQ